MVRKATTKFYCDFLAGRPFEGEDKGGGIGTPPKLITGELQVYQD